MRSNMRILLVSVIVLLTAFCSTAVAQTELPRTEIGLQVSLPVPTENQFYTGTGIGGRLTFNLNKHLAVEGAATYFLNNLGICDIGAGLCKTRRYEGFGDERLLGVFGIKAGRRGDKLGLFLKARPGFMQVNKPTGKVTDCAFSVRIPPQTAQGLCVNRVTYFAFDTGGVVEFYPTKHLMFRADLGTAIVRQRDLFDHHTKGLVQVNVGVGVRF